MFNLTQKWNFPSNNYGQIFGIADSGVETFKGTPIKSLAREICQNSLDAALENNEPTRIEFKTFELDPRKIPDYNGLEDALNRALDFWSQQKSTKAKTFFKQALAVMHKPTITCLRISDFNTSGLVGSREEYNSPWCNLTKSSGASDKSGSNGGSFGIGKFAPYACSSIRTVFYSTSDKEGVCASQGVSRLTSFSRRVAMIRQTGMKIKDKGNINALIPFAGTLFIEGDAINSYLRNLENPQHLEWEVERAENKSKAKRLLKTLLHFIKASLDEMKNDESEEALDPTVGEYLSASDFDQTPNQERTEALQDNIKDFKIRVTEVAPKPSGTQTGDPGQTIVDDEEGDIIVTDLPGEGGSGSQGQGSHGGNGGGANPGDGGGNVPVEHRKKLSAISATSVRNVVRNKTKGEYTIVFTPGSSATNGILEVFMSAESQNYEASIIATSCSECPDLKFEKNRITNLVFTEKKAIRLNIQLDYHDYCSLEVKAYGNQV